VLFEQRFWSGIRDGTITLTFRRWKRRQVVAGGVYRTGGGRVIVDAVDTVDPDRISDDEARRAGYETAADLVAYLRGTPDLPCTRIEFRLAVEPDPRAELAATAALTDDDITTIDRRLERLDRASSTGPWTTAVLDLIATRPGVRAGDLAASLGRERLSFKADVRKLKNLGLTLSLDVGYRLSPRGEAYRSALSERREAGIPPSSERGQSGPAPKAPRAEYT
jgi:hypothetical protein